jgi:type I restriction enzyme, R subunit
VRRWNAADRKQAIIDELAEHGVILENLAAEVSKELDPFDLILHIAYDQRPLTRKERAENVRKRDYFAKYGETARAVLQGLLDKYQDAGVIDLNDPNVLRIAPFTQIGTPYQLIKAFGGKDKFAAAVHEVQTALYRETA